MVIHGEFPLSCMSRKESENIHIEGKVLQKEELGLARVQVPGGGKEENGEKKGMGR